MSHWLTQHPGWELAFLALVGVLWIADAILRALNFVGLFKRRQKRPPDEDPKKWLDDQRRK